MANYNNQPVFWYKYTAPAGRWAEVIDHAQTGDCYSITEYADENGEGWNFDLQLLLQGPQPR